MRELQVAGSAANQPSRPQRRRPLPSRDSSGERGGSPGRCFRSFARARPTSPPPTVSTPPLARILQAHASSCWRRAGRSGREPIHLLRRGRGTRLAALRHDRDRSGPGAPTGHGLTSAFVEPSTRRCQILSTRSVSRASACRSCWLLRRALCRSRRARAGEPWVRSRADESSARLGTLALPGGCSGLLTATDPVGPNSTLDLRCG
jgi:hypothetical protein